MRRPLCYAAVSFAFETVIFRCLGKDAALITILLILISAVLLYCFAEPITAISGKKEKRYFLSMILVVLTSVVCSFADNWCYAENEQYIHNHIDKIKSVSGVVVQRIDKCTSEGKPFVRYKVKISHVNGTAIRRDFVLLISDYTESSGDVTESPLPGESVSAAGECTLAAGRRNPGCFDYSAYLASTGVHGIMTGKVASEDSLCAGLNIRGLMFTLRRGFISATEETAGTETAALISGIMFGDKTLIEDDVIEDFQKNGTAHILAVSGIHVGMLYGFLSFLWRWKKGKLFFSVMSIFFICYVILADFSASVIRAAAMIETHIFASVVNRRYDLNSAAFFVALAAMADNPMQVFNAGFQMSYLAVLMLSLILPYVHKIYTGVLSAGIAVQAGLLPYTVYVFNYLSIFSILVNVPVIMLAGFIVPLGLISMAAMIFCEPLMTLTSGVLFSLGKALTWLNHVTCIDGVTVLDVTSPDIRLIALYYISVFLFMSETGRILIIRRRKKILALCAAMTITAVFIAGACFRDEFQDADIIFVDVGQGDCMHLKIPDGRNYMIDGGGNINYNVGTGTLKPYLLKNGVKKLDGAFVTHLHTDHYKGITELCQEGMVDKLYIYEGNRIRENDILEETGLDKEDIIYLHAGQNVVLDDNTNIDVLWPERKIYSEYSRMIEQDEDENAMSLIMRITHEGRHILMTGDIDKQCHEMLAGLYPANIKTDILKVAHHGSKYSFSEIFTEKAAPETAVFQVGKNNYGHPAETVLEEYSKRNINIFRNDLEGAIGFRWEYGEEMHIMTIAGE